jgi:hypothetical protein
MLNAWNVIFHCEILILQGLVPKLASDALPPPTRTSLPPDGSWSRLSLSCNPGTYTQPCLVSDTHHPQHLPPHPHLLMPRSSPPCWLHRV